MTFAFFISFVILLRIGELLYSKRNEKWLRQNGAVEYGKKHYPLIVALHTLFFLSLIIEYSVQQNPTYSLPIVVLYFVLVACKAWIILSLGKYWNTKIFRIPNGPLIESGPYKFVAHPNYVVVVAEIVVIPLAFHLYYTAVIFSVLNAMILTVRIKEENLALKISGESKL
ncbi:MAG: hypothetical protein HQ472_01425 [Ignavibacteria bacterium]|nr:hypothetical protein [Ignavibacteria bacterium]